MKKLYKEQCASIYHKGLKTENGLMHIIALGKKKGTDYLQHLVDLYDRDRVKNADAKYVRIIHNL